MNQLFDLPQVTTLLGFMSDVIKDFIKLVQVMIRDHFLQR